MTPFPSQLIAITREVSEAIERCELTHLERTPIDLARARRQHRAYEQRLADAGCTIDRVAAGSDMPDSVFVEDIAVVFSEIALVTRPGAESRRGETAAVAEAVGRYRTLACVTAPGTVDGGDVLVVGRRVFVGRSSRTNTAGIEQMREMLGRHGYTVHEVEVTGCLHLKSAVTALSDAVLLMNRAWLGAGEFSGFAIVDVDPAEPFAANALRLADRATDHIIYPAAFPRTLTRLVDRGYRVQTVDVGEFAKAEGGVTCCSLIFATGSAGIADARHLDHHPPLFGA